MNIQLVKSLLNKSFFFRSFSVNLLTMKTGRFFWTRTAQLVTNPVPRYKSRRSVYLKRMVDEKSIRFVWIKTFRQTLRFELHETKRGYLPLCLISWLLKASMERVCNMDVGRRVQEAEAPLDFEI